MGRDIEFSYCAIAEKCEERFRIRALPQNLWAEIQTKATNSRNSNELRYKNCFLFSVSIFLRPDSGSILHLKLSTVAAAAL